MAGLLALHAMTLAYSATRQSPTLNEPGHLAAGIAHWELGRLDLYAVNPPLVRMIAALPILATGAKTDWSRIGNGDRPLVRSEFLIGEDFVAANGPQGFQTFVLSRWSCIPFSLLGAWICFVWGKDLHGSAGGLGAAALWCIEPNILGHGQLITPDLAAASLGLAAGYLFWRWLKRPAWAQALAAGLALGLAQLAKTSWVILFPLWPALWIAWSIRLGRTGWSRHQWQRTGGQLVLMLTAALYLINLGYGFEGTMTRLRDFKFISRTLAGPQPAQETGNRFNGSWAGAIPVPLPKRYIMGMDMQRRDFEESGRVSYLQGEWRHGGWWYYYLYGAFVKVPHGVQLLVLAALVAALMPRSRDQIVARRDELVLLAPVAALLILASSQTGFNHHFRYILPAFGFVIVFSGRAARWWASRSPFVCRGTTALFLWAAVSTFSTYPHCLTYFNELAGGPLSAPRHMLHSSADWGQDLVSLGEWLESHPEARPLYLVYYGGFNPRAMGITYRLPRRQNSPEVAGLPPGYYAISLNFLCGDRWRAPAPDGGWRDLPRNTFANLPQAGRLVATAGYSIRIYNVSSAAGVSTSASDALDTIRRNPESKDLTLYFP